MKARIHVTLKPGILDPQGRAVEHALSTLGYKSVSNVRIGKHIELTLDESAVSDIDAQMKAICEKLLANTIIEEYAYELESEHNLPMPEPQENRVLVLDEEEVNVPVKENGVLPPLPADAADEGPVRVEDPTTWAGESISPGQDAKAQEEARRLAKRILSDLASLNPRAIDEAVKQGNFRQSLKEDIEEGLRLYRQQVPEAVRAHHDFFGEAIDAFILERQRMMGMR
jgi:phosphoribosylformylglycinamidine synthase PurS subunit